MNDDLMIVLIVAIVMIASVAKVKYGYGGRRGRRWGPDQTTDDRADHDEKMRLLDEVQQLKERIKVLERITVDKENSLAKEIESLRDR